ncbi:type II toxin-antitoxin system death-on-curing family toxin [Buchananella hordeovulneris]|uniref:type II toxin-antitoxin system death-on-curing family toxin n=1 Tax=Buchananella hordeovulneris TaxID=52770 RepID=UPI000F5ED0C8|nr:type II toxin-antitoxin system death-on-curing family toxin [Buchananella hordeovulneris]RRD42073.1 type II toxin-antitoxin system death-on-curing family toxin [Buchananella hordeovulneris]
MSTFLTLEDLLQLIADLGVGPVRDLGLLQAAARRPQTELWGTPVYSTLTLQAAALLDSLVRNHALLDGNKRLGWLATVVFLGLNGCDLQAPDDDAFALVMAVASGEQLELAAVARQLASWCVPLASPLP